MDHLTQDCNITNIQIELLVSEGNLARSLPKTKDAFHRFPETGGWQLNEEHKLEISASVEAPMLNFGVLLQAWLYFGLILSVVQKDGKPILHYEELCNGRYLSTKNLTRAIEDWVRWESHHPDGRQLRLIQAGYVLEKARRVVRQNCSCKLQSEAGMEDDASEDSSGAGEMTRKQLRAEPDGYSTKIGEARHLTDQNGLALMVVGEFLWAAKSRLIEQCGENLTGWHGDDDAGWGPPRYILHRMIDRAWCPRAVFLLKGLLRSSATLLLHAYSTYKDSRRMVRWHDDCDKDTCRAKTTDDSGQYANLCLPDCDFRDKGGCAMLGPEMDGPQGILSVLASSDISRGQSDIPLIRFESNRSGDISDLDPISFAVETLRPQNAQPFATISHVWSDGWGNEKVNKLRTCQLRYIRRQLRRANGGRDIPFWMDTLIVPVREFKEGEEMDWKWRELKTKAIAQIFELFAKSTYTIILDNGLCSMSPGEQDKPADAAMMILASDWMRRLWTLHEAFLSKKRYITFYDSSLDHDNLTNMESLLEQLKMQVTQQSPLVHWVRELLLQNLMDQESKIFADPEKRFAQRQAAMLVSGAWRATRWRTTSNAAHETLALATLLNVTYRGTEIEEAGLTMNAPVDKLNRLVRDFWREFHTTYKNCIPAGMIFLPGEKVDLQGYGWAPKTWMTAHEVDYPDPLSRWTAETDLLEGKGLLVQYPGFRLHTDSKKARGLILGVDQTTTLPSFTFPVDSSLLEWYTVRPADPAEKIACLEAILNNKNPLGIIISRPHPKASPPEIGLLVEIYSIDDEKIRREGDDASPQRYSCQVIRRVHVCRETGEMYITGPGRNGPTNRKASPHWRIIGGSYDEIRHDCIVGKTLSASQKWIVDGYLDSERGKRKTPRKTHGPTDSAPRQAQAASSSKGKANGSGKDPPNSAPRATAGAHKEKAVAPPPNLANSESYWKRITTSLPRIMERAPYKAESTPTPARPAPGPGRLPRGQTAPPEAPFPGRGALAYPSEGRRPARRATVLWDAT